MFGADCARTSTRKRALGATLEVTLRSGLLLSRCSWLCARMHPTQPAARFLGRLHNNDDEEGDDDSHLSAA